MGETGQRLLVDALMTQKLVGGKADLARKIAELSELVEVNSGTAIIEQGGSDNDAFLIISGSFGIFVNGRKVAVRHPNDHVGEMAAIEPLLPRSASLVALEQSVVCKLTEPQLTALAQEYPHIWRYIAKELAHRLMQRNKLVTTTRKKIRVFIMSSVEALEIARTIQSAFEHDPFTVVIWTDGVFRASQYAIESLERELDQSDFAIAIVQPDDRTETRGQSHPSPRDNVMFELGFFMGRLGRHRTLLLEPRGEKEEVKLPTDLKGINTVKYKYEVGEHLAASMGPACNQIRQIIKETGPNN